MYDTASTSTSRRPPARRETPRLDSKQNSVVTERKAKWCRLAKAVAARHTAWNTLQIATVIQRFQAGRRRGGPLRYSIGYIARNIRPAIE